jgi:hypothetical protein
VCVELLHTARTCNLQISNMFAKICTADYGRFNCRADFIIYFFGLRIKAAETL